MSSSSIVAQSSPLTLPSDNQLSNCAPENPDVPESPSDACKGQRELNFSMLEFEARSSKDDAWYDVASFLSHRNLTSDKPEVLVRFVGFGAEEDEWVNVKNDVRVQSLPVEAHECNKIAERKDHATHHDAHVLDIQRRLHDIRGCRCIFLVRYDHDHCEEKVSLRRICRRPTCMSDLTRWHVL